MLIGPTFTLEEFEGHLEERLLTNRTRDAEAMKRFRALQEQIATLPRLVDDEQTGEKIANKEYLEAYNKGQKVQEEMTEISEQNAFIKAKLEELETIEERSRGAIRKDKEKITLSLKDCLELGIETSGEN